MPLCPLAKRPEGSGCKRGVKIFQALENSSLFKPAEGLEEGVGAGEGVGEVVRMFAAMEEAVFGFGVDDNFAAVAEILRFLCEGAGAFERGGFVERSVEDNGRGLFALHLVDGREVFRTGFDPLGSEAIDGCVENRVEKQ